MTHDDLKTKPELRFRLTKLLGERLEKEKMTPFYKINEKMYRWMYRNGIRNLRMQDWYSTYDLQATRPAPEGRVGLIFKPENKYVKYRTRSGPGEKVVHSKWFHLELPADLCAKALLLGEFP